MAKSKSFDNLSPRPQKKESTHRCGSDVLPLSQKLETRGFVPGMSCREKQAQSAHRATDRQKIGKAANRYRPQKKTGVIYIKERYFTMLKKDLILRNPLHMMGFENDDILSTGSFGAVLARSGVGKTAFLVQLSLNDLLRGKNVLHISLEDPVNKVSLWYKEVFNLIAEQYKVDPINQLWESLLPHRFIMTFRVEGFSVPKLQERLADLMEQNIFSPQMIIVDGFPFDESMQQPLNEFKKLVEDSNMHAWFTVRTHRDEEPAPDGMPLQLSHVSELFEIAIQLLPVGKEIYVKAIKGGDSFSKQLDLRLDPSTMLIKNK
jgi:hypothetical protein